MTFSAGAVRVQTRTAAVALRMLLASVLAAALVSRVASAGVLPSAACHCQGSGSDAYSLCSQLQDLKSLLSFTLGAAFCKLLATAVTSQDDEESRPAMDSPAIGCLVI